MTFLGKTKAHRRQQWRDDMTAITAYYEALQARISKCKPEHYRAPQGKTKAKAMSAEELVAAMRASLPPDKR